MDSDDFENFNYGLVCSFKQETNQLETNSLFLKKLLQNPDKKVKVVTVIGAKGHGKSTVLNSIIINSKKIYPYQKYGPFNQSDESKDGTYGIEFFYCETEEDAYLFLDCQGFDDSLFEDNFYKRLRYLICLICKISSVVIHVTTEIRETAAFPKFLQVLDIEKTFNYNQKNLLCNFIEIVNQRKPKNFKKEKYPDLILEAFYLENINQQGKTIQIEEITPNNQQIFNKIENIILNSEYNPLNRENYSCFVEDRTQKTLHKLLNSSFTILDQDIPPEQTICFLQLVNESIKVDIKCKNVYDESQQIVENKLITINNLFKQCKPQPLISSYFYSQIIVVSVILKQQSISLNLIKDIYKEWQTKFQKIKDQFEKQSNQSQEKLNKSYDKWFQSFPVDLRPWERLKQSQDIDVNMLAQFGFRLSIIGFLTAAGSLIFELTFPRICAAFLLTGGAGIVAGAALLVAAFFKQGYQFFKKHDKELVLNELNNDWLQMALNQTNYDTNIQKTIQSLLSKKFDKFQRELQKFNSIKQKYYSILSFINIIFTLKQNKDDKALENMKKYANIIVSAIQQFKQEHQIEKNPIPRDFFENILQFKQKGFDHNSFKFLDGQITINNSELLNKVDNYLKQDHKWRNIFSLLVVLNNLHPNFLNYFFIETFFSHHISESDCYEIFHEEKNIKEFIEFQNKFLELE
ncbi:hypothetical protein ABPG72_021965 [Tetrahymena utriculariae]